VKRIPFIVGLLFIGSMALSPIIRAQEQPQGQDGTSLDLNTEDDTDGGRQLRQPQQTESGLRPDSLDDQTSHDSSYDSGDAAINGDDSSENREHLNNPDTGDRSSRDDRPNQIRPNNQDNQGDQNQVNPDASIDQTEIEDPAQQPNRAETEDPAEQPGAVAEPGDGTPPTDDVNPGR
jgi:hypothetical protein